MRRMGRIGVRHVQMSESIDDRLRAYVRNERQYNKLNIACINQIIRSKAMSINQLDMYGMMAPWRSPTAQDGRVGSTSGEHRHDAHALHPCAHTAEQGRMESQPGRSRWHLKDGIAFFVETHGSLQAVAAPGGIRTPQTGGHWGGAACKNRDIELK